MCQSADQGRSALPSVVFLGRASEDMSKGARGGRVGGISKFEMRKLEIGECEGENVVLWCGV